MTNELEKQFFDAFGIERSEGLEWECYSPDNCTKTSCVCPENCTKCEYFGKEMVYPQITSSHYLELIEILLNFEYIGLKKGKDHYSVDFQGWLEQRENSLKNAILKSLIFVADSEFKDVVYNQVQALFKEGL